MSIAAIVAKTVGASVAKEVVPDLFDKLARGNGKGAERVAEAATQIVQDIAGITPTTKADEAVEALKADPVAYARVQEALTQKAIAEIHAEVALREAENADRANAREMHIKRGDRAIFTLMVFTMIAFIIAFGVVAWMAINGVELDGMTGGAVIAVVTAITFRLEQVFNFFCGSSLGSKKKDDDRRLVEWSRE